MQAYRPCAGCHSLSGIGPASHHAAHAVVAAAAAARGDPKLVDVAVQSRISSRLSYMDFSDETTAHFNEVARSMLSMNASAPRKATEAL